MSDEMTPAPKKKMVALGLALMAGPLGVHRFYLSTWATSARAWPSS